MMKVSVVISTRDEGSNLAFTVQSIINDLETFLQHDEFELILVHNNPTDPTGWRFLMERGMFFHRTIKVLFDPIAGNVSARNKGVALATGKYLFFADAHVSFRIGSFKAMCEAIDEYGGIVHCPVQWLGGYEPSEASYQYSIKVGEKLWGTWNRLKVADKPFYIPVSGHCFLGMLRDEFMKLGGYHPMFRCYGGGELYLDLKAWMLGSTVMCVPDALVYHLSAGRGYSFKQDDLIHNMILLAYALGADAMAERVFLRYLDKDGVHHERLVRMRNDAFCEAAVDRERLPLTQSFSFYDLLTEKPWDTKNIALHGKASSGLLIYDKTWTNTLSGEAKALFENSDLQRELQDRIDHKWKQWVYSGAV